MKETNLLRLFEYFRRRFEHLNDYKNQKIVVIINIVPISTLSSDYHFAHHGRDHPCLCVQQLPCSQLNSLMRDVIE